MIRLPASLSRPRRAAALGLVAASSIALAATAAPATGEVANDHHKPPPLSSITAKVQNEEHLTFKVSYRITGSGESASSITFEQRPPDQRFGSAGSFILILPKKVYFCEAAAGSKPMCMVESGNPMSGLVDLFAPAAVLEQLQRYESAAVQKLSGVTITTSSRTYAGQASTCVTVTAKGGSGSGGTSTGTWCVTDAQGILSYIGSSGSVVTMTSYSPSAPAGDFRPPAGATINTA
jgi:hypothetical protein